MAAVTIPVMAKCRIGHFAEAQIIEALEVDMIDESEGNYRKSSLRFLSENGAKKNFYGSVMQYIGHIHSKRSIRPRGAYLILRF